MAGVDGQDHLADGHRLEHEALIRVAVGGAHERRQLVLPLDVHSARQARALGLVTRKANDWQAALDLTRRCRDLCPDDPARYDFAFFGVGAYGESLDERFVAG